MHSKPLICPSCQSTLTRVRKPRNIYWACTRCGGRSSTISLMRQFMPGDLVNQIWQTVRRGNPRRIRTCPSCNQKMAQFQVPGQSFVIDACRTCTFVWFDPGEYQAMPLTPRDAKAPGKELPPKMKTLLAEQQVKDLRRKARNEKQSPDGLWKIIPGILGMPVEFDYQRSRAKPVATWGVALLIAIISLLAFTDHESVVLGLGFIPAEWNRLGGFTILTSFFLHGSLMHLVSNLYFLLAFGDNVEEHVGILKFIFLLLVATAAGDWIHLSLDPSSATPCIGASGGISGLLLYYALQFRDNRIGLFFLFRWIRLPVAAYIFFWVFIQIAGTQVEGSGVAYGAHLGGALAGLVFWLLQKYSVKLEARQSRVLH
ncbi:MAG: rhomboid family intramembrane serine protease [Verrucomicrobiota bacterium]